MKKITIREVAKEAGVSVSAVSRVFNDYSDIGEETRKRVLKAAKDLDYFPNNAAKQLSSKRKRVIALILNEINVTRGVAMPLEILGGVIEELDKTDYEFVFYAVNSKKQVQKSLKQFCSERDITGLIIQGLRMDDPYYKELETLDVPTVAIDMEIAHGNVGNVSTDNRRAVAEVTKRLFAAGKKEVLFVNGSQTAAVALAREKGFKDILPEGKIAYANFSEEEAYELIMQCSNLEAYKVIFAASDLMAIGVIKALRKKNLIGQIDVIGFDDITLASYISPALTTVRQDISLFTKTAVKDLIRQIKTGKVSQHFIPYEIVVRESCQL